MSDFKPTEEQAAAVQDIIDWYRHRSSVEGFQPYVLKGYAGTGKTYLMTHLARTGLMPEGAFDRRDHPLGYQFVRPWQICFTAPTNKAVKVLRNYLDNAGLAECPTKTIYGLLGLSLQPNGELREISTREEPVDLSRYKLIVVDEGSMVNTLLNGECERAFQEWGVPFLFMGDPAQLPPVGEQSTPIWKFENQSTLTQVMRYGDSMLELATAIRKVVDHPFPSIRIDNKPPIYRLGRTAWLDAIVANLELFKSGEAKCIAWRNIKVDEYNHFIRGHIFGRPEAKSNIWLPGDKIVATAHLKDIGDEIFMRTDEEATIVSIALGKHPRYNDYEIWNLLCTDENGRHVTIRTLTPQGRFALNNELERLGAEARNGKKFLWNEFWKLKDAFNEIRHSYSITSHRSQGSSYTKVFIDLEDIMLNRNRQEAFRSLYVSCTRQREELYVA